MSTPQISLGLLARSAYRPAAPQPGADGARFGAEPPRETVKSSQAVRVELSAEARAALLSLQEVGATASARPAAPEAPEGPAPRVSHGPPGGLLNLSI